MFESLLSTGSGEFFPDENAYLIFMDAERGQVGDTHFTNYGTVKDIVKYYEAANAVTPNHGIQNVPGYGKAYYFNGGVYFGKNAWDALGNILASNFEIIIDFKAEVRGRVDTLVATGGYADNQSNYSGMSLYLNGEVARYGQLFANNALLPRFERYYNNAPQPASLEDKFTITKVAGPTRVAFKDSVGTTYTNIAVTPNRDTCFSLGAGAEAVTFGASRYPQYNFRGWIKSIKIRKVS